MMLRFLRPPPQTSTRKGGAGNSIRAIAATVKAANPDLTVIAVGMIAGAHQAETILEEGKADMIAIARAALDDPRWPHHAAEALDGAKDNPTPWPVQYQRAAGEAWPGYKLRDFG